MTRAPKPATPEPPIPTELLDELVELDFLVCEAKATLDRIGKLLSRKAKRPRPRGASR